MKPFTTIAAFLFALVSLGHLIRLAFRWDIMVDGARVPLWVSLVGALVTGLLAAMLWREARPPRGTGGAA